MNMHTSRHHFAITSSFVNVAELAEQASNLLAEKTGKNAELCDSLRLCLAEALNNVVEHAYSGEDGQPIEVNLSLDVDGFEVEVRDRGKPMPDNTLPDGAIDFDAMALNELPEGGFGWFLIRNEVDRLDYLRLDGCNILSLGKKTCA